ncbi:putative disease resistance protein RGA3 isoform X2 [Oryza sativa Japonica Group]|uniref:putative disease resistance protein RGA3 isoform X2 n=1 Tax=Oryza sativa subsp. japonica TaxID=39947 RepID=UPI000775432C|nr:putative disease resistance RPP13-like protein 1 isoform X2 [Oryza sativa Japonica Group]
MASGLVSSLLSSTSSLLAILRSPLSDLYPRSGHPTASADLQRLKRLLSRIQATLEDAEEQGLQDNYVKLWLKELKDLALDAEDVLDDYRYELLQSQVQELQGDYPRKRKHMDNDEEDNDSIDERINEMINRFEEISRDRDALKLRFEDGHKIVDRGNWMKSRPTSHLIDESLVFGRIDEKEDIIKSVLSHQDMEPSGIVVLPIVGMGGIGKTTIAQMVYNDSRVRKHFEHSGWIHVSPTFDVHKLTIAITESLTMKNYGFTQLSLVHGVLLEEVQGKKLFFVLDDLWNECESSWQDFLSPLRHAQTVTILVTTRSKEVARLVQTVQLYHLGCIPDKDCWLLFQHYAFGNQHESEQSILVQIGRKILQKCGGLPLAVKSLGCLLRSTMDEHAWMEILESELWELDEEDNIFPALRLSYYWLPTRLKPCFLLCSLYPRNLGFTKDDIIQLWVAQGYIYSTNGKTCREIGNEYFNELHARSLIETYRKPVCWDINKRKLCLSRFTYNERQGFSSKKRERQGFSSRNEGRQGLSSKEKAREAMFYLKNKLQCETYLKKPSTSIGRFKLHDVIFDLAKSFTRGEQCTAMFGTTCMPPVADLKLQFPNPRSVRTLVLNCCFRCYKKHSGYFMELSSFMYLRSLILNSNHDVSGMVYSIGNLRHLRYLSLNCKMRELPESVCRLHSLETLIISSLRILKSSNFQNLFSLRCLHVSFDFMDGSLDQFSDLYCLGTLCLKHCCNITYLPLHIRSLLNLQHLQLVGISNIRRLDHASFRYNKSNSTWQPDALFPSLESLELENLCNLEDLCGLQNSDCSKLQSLTVRNCSKLSRIPCFTSLRNLVISKSVVKIIQFSLGNMPSNLQTIDIRDCFHLSTLVGLQNLSCLMSLYISHCPQLLILPSENMPCKPCHAFVADCPKLKQWCEKHEFNYFQVTRKMHISDVRLITEYGVKNFVAVQHLTIENCTQIGQNLLSSTKSWLPSNLRFLQFSSCTFSGVLNFHKGLSMLSGLEIRNCAKLESLIGLNYLNNLRGLVLVECPLLDMSTGTKFPDLLSSLIIRGCHQLLSLHLCNPAVLTELEISDCRGFMYIGGLRNFRDLESLKLLHCPLLQLRDLMPAAPETAVICCCPRLKKWCEWHDIEYKENPEDSYGKL